MSLNEPGPEESKPEKLIEPAKEYTEAYESLLQPLRTTKVHEHDPTGLREVKTIDKNGFSALKPSDICQVKRHNMEGEPILKILTYNIWFNFVTHERMAEILKIIEKSDADFVCLQEVTELSRQIILLSKLVREKYLNVGGTASGNGFLGEYGTVIISRYPCLYFEKHFKSRMGRTLLCAEPQLPMNIIVATAHYESL